MIRLKRIAELPAVIEFIGNNEILINDLIQLDVSNQRDDVLYWCSDKNIESLLSCNAGTVICSQKIKTKNYINHNCNYIIVDNPRLFFAQVLRKFFIVEKPVPIISSKAVIHSSVSIGKNVFIGDFTVVEENCVIGDNTYIGYNNTILSKTIIENDVKIGNNNTIGGVGFGYEKDENGEYEVLPHIGNVLIHCKVEIGNNTCIDRAVLGSTIIHKNVKIDNLVHVAHGVIIQENSLIIAHAMIGGSTEIGKNVWVAPGALIINKGKVGNDSLIGMGAVVVKQVDEKTVVAGNPARFLKNI